MKLAWECKQKTVLHLPLPQTCTALLLMLPNIMRKISLHRNLILDSQLCIKKSSLWSDFTLPSSVLPFLGHPELGLELELGKNHPEVTVSHIFIQMVVFSIASSPVMKRRGNKFPKLGWSSVCSLSFCGLPKCWDLSAHPLPSPSPDNYPSFIFQEASLCI